MEKFDKGCEEDIREGHKSSSQIQGYAESNIELRGWDHPKTQTGLTTWELLDEWGQA